MGCPMAVVNPKLCPTQVSSTLGDEASLSTKLIWIRHVVSSHPFASQLSIVPLCQAFFSILRLPTRFAGTLGWNPFEDHDGSMKIESQRIYLWHPEGRFPILERQRKIGSQCQSPCAFNTKTVLDQICYDMWNQTHSEWHMAALLGLILLHLHWGRQDTASNRLPKDTQKQRSLCCLPRCAEVHEQWNTSREVSTRQSHLHEILRHWLLQQFAVRFDPRMFSSPYRPSTEAKIWLIAHLPGVLQHGLVTPALECASTTSCGTIAVHWCRHEKTWTQTEKNHKLQVRHVCVYVSSYRLLRCSNCFWGILIHWSFN